MLVAKGESFPAFFVEQPAVFAGQSSPASGDLSLHGIVESAHNAELRWPDFAPYKTEVAKLYDLNNYSLVWIQNGRVRSQGLAVIDLLQNANAKGLEPEDYDCPRWQNRLLKLTQSPSEQHLASLDTALTVSVMRYIRAVHCGRVSPKEFKFQLGVEGSPLPLDEFIQTHVLNASDRHTTLISGDASSPAPRQRIQRPGLTRTRRRRSAGTWRSPRRATAPT
jgi:murein L,D-transpeptidase YcbB/YkuD